MRGQDTRGVVLAAGRGSRLYPMTSVLSKELLPVYDKPMIYYAFALTMLAGIREILVVANPENRRFLEELLGDGRQWGVSISFVVQPEPKGIAAALLDAEEFVGGQRCMLVLGDNIVVGQSLPDSMREAARDPGGCTIFGVQVPNPESYGVVSFDELGMPSRITEKPNHPDSNWIVPGIYFYDNTAFGVASCIEPSGRGELEISDVNDEFLSAGKLRLVRLQEEVSWFDAGTPARFLDAANHIRAISENLGTRVMVPEEIAYRNGWITAAELAATGRAMLPSGYGQHLLRVSDKAVIPST